MGHRFLLNVSLLHLRRTGAGAKQQARILPLVEEVMLRHAYIDPDRVILTGLSMGGGECIR